MEAKIVARAHAAAGQEERLRSLFDALVEQTVQEPGCIEYQVYTGKDPANFLVFEHYVDVQAHQIHRDTLHYRKYAPQIVACLDHRLVAYRLDQIEVPVADG